jgi:HEAT repeat protein
VVLSRLDGGLTAEAMSCVALGERHLNSTGLTWALGEMPNHRIETIHWLERVIVETKKSKTWWRAAFSLQKLGQGDAVERLMRDVGRTGLPSLAECLDDLGDERNMIAALIHANSSSEAMRSVAASVRESYLEAEDDPSLVNCAWLIGRLRIMDEEILERVRGLSIDPSHDVRYYALYALQNNSTPAGEDIAVRALDDADPLIRRIAVRVLGVIGTDTARLALLSLMRREHDPKVVSEAENQMVQTT